MNDPYKITLDKKHIDVIDLEHYLDEGNLTIIYDIGIDHREWGIKGIDVVIRHIYGDLTLEVEDEASDLLLEDPIFKEDLMEEFLQPEEEEEKRKNDEEERRKEEEKRRKEEEEKRGRKGRSRGGKGERARGGRRGIR